MKIGLFHSELPLPDRKVGGVGVYVHRLANGLVEKGHDVKVWTLSPFPADARYEVVRLGSPSLMSKVRRLTVVPLVLQMTSFSDREVLHLHGDDWFYLYRRLPTVRTFHGSALRESRHATSLRRRIAQALVFPAEVLSSRLATASFSVGPDMPKSYRVEGYLSPPFNTSRLQVARSERPSILFVGTWEGRKRGRWLAEQFSLVRAQVPDAELWLVSDQVLEADHARFIKYPTDHQLRELYARAWVFCMPSTYEGFGLPYVESMIQGTPVVATPNPGANYVLADGGGLIVRDEEVATTISTLLLEPSTRARLGQEALAAARKFSVERSIAAHEWAYDLAVAKWRRSREGKVA